MVILGGHSPGPRVGGGEEGEAGMDGQGMMKVKCKRRLTRRDP